jgi:hypothetical protein
MSWSDGPLDEMERHLGRPDRTDPLTLDDGTAERLFRGEVSVDDAPRSYQRVTAVLAALTAAPSATELSGEGEAVEDISRRIAAAASSPPRSRSTKMKMKRRFQIAGVTLVGSATLLSGLGAAGALPGAAQGIASDMLSTVGVSVPNPNSHSDGHADQRGRSGDAVNTADTGGAQSTDTGSTVSGVAKDPSTTGVDKGAAVSSVASDGQSRAGEVTPPAGPPADPTASAPVATPNPGGTGTADGASGGQSDPGTGTAGDVSGGRSTTGSGNADDGLTHKP